MAEVMLDNAIMVTRESAGETNDAARPHANTELATPGTKPTGRFSWMGDIGWTAWTLRDELRLLGSNLEVTMLTRLPLKDSRLFLIPALTLAAAVALTPSGSSAQVRLQCVAMSDPVLELFIPMDGHGVWDVARGEYLETWDIIQSSGVIPLFATGDHEAGTVTVVIGFGDSHTAIEVWTTTAASPTKDDWDGPILVEQDADGMGSVTVEVGRTYWLEPVELAGFGDPIIWDYPFEGPLPPPPNPPSSKSAVFKPVVTCPT